MCIFTRFLFFYLLIFVDLCNPNLSYAQLAFMVLAVIAASAAICGKLLSFCDECGVRTSSGAERVSAKVKLKEHFIAELILVLMLPLV